MTKSISEESEKSPSESLQDLGMYVFMGQVDNESIKPIIEWILYENYVVVSRKQELLFMICSEGGDLSSTFALIDTMNGSHIPIKTVGLGQIASCGLLIFMNGTKGRRVLTSNTSILSHQFSAGSEGKSHELFATMREFQLTNERMIKHYKKCTNLSEDKVKEYLLPAQDRWLSHDEALKWGICDFVADTSQEPVQSRPAKIKKSKNT